MTVIRPHIAPPARRRLPSRAGVLAFGAVSALAMVAIVTAAHLADGAAARPDFAARLLPPALDRPFGTDILGRDLLMRTVQGLALSLQVGLVAAAISTAIAILAAVAAATMGRIADAAVSFLVDMALGLPHLVLLVLIAFALGGGTTAVIVAVAATHWPRLARILRAEILQLVRADYVTVSRRFGRSWGFIVRGHLLPHLLPQILVGFVLLFPHAILHEAALTFLGFGLEPGRPAIGILLADSMRHLTAGHWWLGLFPGLCLVLMVLAFDGLAGSLRAATSPREARS